MFCASLPLIGERANADNETLIILCLLVCEMSVEETCTMIKCDFRFESEENHLSLPDNKLKRGEG
jgi:hypothetical protein